MKWSKRTLPIIFDDHMHPKTFRVKMAEYVNNLLEEAKGNLEAPATSGEEGQIPQSNGDGTMSWVNPEDLKVLKNETVEITLIPGVFYSNAHIYAKRYGNVILLYGEPKFDQSLTGQWTTVANLPEGMSFINSQFFCDAGGSGNINLTGNNIKMRNYSHGVTAYFSALALLDDSV